MAAHLYMGLNNYWHKCKVEAQGEVVPEEGLLVSGHRFGPEWGIPMFEEP